MIRDSLDILNPKTRFTATAKYYAEPFNGPEVGAAEFNYEYVNPFSNTYRRLFANIQGSAGEVAIRTDDQINYKINGIVITQDGQAFKVLQIEKDYQSANKQVMRILGTPVSTEYVLRLVSIDNPWGAQ